MYTKSVFIVYYINKTSYSPQIKKQTAAAMQGLVDYEVNEAVTMPSLETHTGTCLKQ